MEKESCLAVYVRPPRPGAYILNIAVNRTQNEGAADSETADNQYEDVCEYCLIAKISRTACLLPFPHEASGVYGQTKKAKLFNVRAVRREPTVREIQGNVELRFASIDSKRPLPRLMGEVKSAALSEEAMKHCIVQRPLSNSTDFVFSIFLPDAGDYSLEVYANDPQRDGSTFKQVSSA
ncbi:unnamed protein product [Dibothriocephalus latus]|uniref:Uncharacterized protein n=1 Tax=Dibothriocephalus latus TaxID=60516 RepID=A0A3P7NCJ7_DIBLA|nr:unnamed protein product [Dibothriocephalus latus]